jgi:hypothetical protein
LPTDTRLRREGSDFVSPMCCRDMDSPKKGSKRIPVSFAFLSHPTVSIHLDEPGKSDQTGTLRLHVPV